MNAETMNTAAEPGLAEEETGQQLAPIEPSEPVEERARRALDFDRVKERLELLPGRSAHIVAVSNMAEHRECHLARTELKRTRCAIQHAGKSARDDAQRFVRAVKTAEESLVAIIKPEEERLAAIQSAFETEQAAKAERERQEREAEERRIADRLEAMRVLPLSFVDAKSDAIRAASLRLAEDRLEDLPEDRQEEARAVRAAAFSRLEHLAAVAEKREAAEEEARQQREEAERKQAEAQAKLREEAERLEAERKRQADALAEERAELERQRAELERQQAEARKKAAAEERRQAEEREAAERQRREEEERQRAEAERVRREREEAERREREAAEAKARADREAAEAAERARQVREATLAEAVGEALELLRELAPGHLATAKLARVFGELCQAQAVQS